MPEPSLLLPWTKLTLTKNPLIVAKINPPILDNKLYLHSIRPNSQMDKLIQNIPNP